MIRSFNHTGLKRFWSTGSKAGIPAQMADRIRIRLLVLDDATTVSDLNIQGYGLHQLKGQRKGEWSVRVSGNWRIVFRMDTPGEVTVVDLEDYH